VQRDGQPVTDPVDRRRIMAEAVTTMLEKRLPVLLRLGGAGWAIKRLPSQRRQAARTSRTGCMG